MPQREATPVRGGVRPRSGRDPDRRPFPPRRHRRTIRSCVPTSTPPVVKVIEAMPPRSLAETIALVCCPGDTLAPVDVPVIDKVGGVLSSTAIETGAALVTCPFESTAEA